MPTIKKSKDGNFSIEIPDPDATFTMAGYRIERYDYCRITRVTRPDGEVQDYASYGGVSWQDVFRDFVAGCINGSPSDVFGA